MMLPDEIAYLNAYHKRVYEELSPYLSEEEKEWLKSPLPAPPLEECPKREEGKM